MASNLFHHDSIDQQDPLELEMMTHYATIKALTDSHPEETHVQLLQSNGDKGKHNEIVLACIYGYLTDVERSAQWLNIMIHIVRDGFKHAAHLLASLSGHVQFHRMQLGCMHQLVSITGELMKSQAHEMQRVYPMLLKQMQGGNFTQFNSKFCEHLLKISVANRSWIVLYPRIIRLACFCFLRMSSEHILVAALRPFGFQEAEFSVSLIRSHFAECLETGRDLARALQDTAKVPAVDSLWRDLLSNPPSIHPSCQGLWQLMQRPTPKEIIAHRLTVDQERRLVHILTTLTVDNYTINLQWFRNRYLVMESETCVADVIRYIICVWHPNNEVLRSKIVPRYIVLISLLESMSLQWEGLHAANAKLALFYDWLAFDPSKDSIMLIEPAMLILTRCLDTHPHYTAILLEFLCHLAREYAVAHGTQISSCVRSAMEQCWKKGVIPSLTPLLHGRTLPKGVRDLAIELFGSINGTAATTLPAAASTVPKQPLPTVAVESKPAPAEPTSPVAVEPPKPELVPTEELKAITLDDQALRAKYPIVATALMELAKAVREEKDGLTVRTALNKALTLHCKTLSSSPLVASVCGPILQQYATTTDTTKVGDDHLDHPSPDTGWTDMLYDYCIQVKDNAATRPRVLELTALLARDYADIWNKWLLHLVSHNHPKDMFGLPFGEADLHEQFSKCMLWIASHQVHLAVPVFERCLTLYADYAVGNVQVIREVLPLLEPHQAFRWFKKLRTRAMTVFGMAFLRDDVPATLEWDTFSQITLWQLLAAECMRRPAHVAALASALLAHVDPQAHVEACTQLLYICNGTRPDEHLLFSVPWEQFEETKVNTGEGRELRERRRWLLTDMLTGWMQWNRTLAMLLGEGMRKWGRGVDQVRLLGLLRALAALDERDSIATHEAFKKGFDLVVPILKARGRMPEFACFAKHLDQPFTDEAPPPPPPKTEDKPTRKRGTPAAAELSKANNGKPRTTINSSKKRRILHSESDHALSDSD